MANPNFGTSFTDAFLSTYGAFNKNKRDQEISDLQAQELRGRIAAQDKARQNSRMYQQAGYGYDEGDWAPVKDGQQVDAYFNDTFKSDKPAKPAKAPKQPKTALPPQGAPQAAPASQGQAPAPAPQGQPAPAPTEAAPTPNPDATIPDRGYGYRYGTQQQPDTQGWGTLPPNDSPVKGNGYYGMMGRSDNPDQQSSEYSIGVTVNGKNYHVPSLVPGMTKPEIDSVLAGKPLPSVQQKATAWAEKRISAGLPVYATAAEEGRFKPVDEAPAAAAGQAPTKSGPSALATADAANAATAQQTGQQPADPMVPMWSVKHQAWGVVPASKLKQLDPVARTKNAAAIAAMTGDVEVAGRLDQLSQSLEKGNIELDAAHIAEANRAIQMQIAAGDKAGAVQTMLHGYSNYVHDGIDGHIEKDPKTGHDVMVRTGAHGIVVDRVDLDAVDPKTNTTGLQRLGVQFGELGQPGGLKSYLTFIGEQTTRVLTDAHVKASTASAVASTAASYQSIRESNHRMAREDRADRDARAGEDPNWNPIQFARDPDTGAAYEHRTGKRGNLDRSQTRSSDMFGGQWVDSMYASPNVNARVQEQVKAGGVPGVQNGVPGVAFQNKFYRFNETLPGQFIRKR